LERLDRIGGWLRSILHNLHIDALRRGQRQGTRIGLADAENDPGLATPGQDSVTAMDFSRALERLSFEHRQVLLLVGLEGLNYREVAQELAIPVGTVMSRLARARERLRYEMEFPPTAHVKPKP